MSSGELLPSQEVVSRPLWRLPSRKYGYKRLFLALTATTLLGLFYFSDKAFRWTSGTTFNTSFNTSTPLELSKFDPLDPLASLNGPPTMSFRDNLRNGTQYVTSWPSAGWTNDVMTYGNLIYFGLMSDRIPIVGSFTPSHVGGHVTPVPFGEVFDVPRLRRLLGKPILEWREVKNENSTEIDDLGCWNIWETSQEAEKKPRGSRLPVDLGLDLSYTLAPSWIKLYPQFPNDFHCSLFSLLALAFPHFRNEYLTTPRPSPLHEVSLPPDEQLLCFDYLYFVGTSMGLEYEYDFSPAWRRVGQFMRWEPRLEALGDVYVRRAIGVPDGEPTPPYISIHIRHNDFLNWCNGVPREDCFAKIPVIARRVREVQDELRSRGRHVEHVIMTSDEDDPAWWAEVRALGWSSVDHSMTVDLFGPWYPVFIDAVIQSNGHGFVGTDRSTMSVMARRRVESWHDGPTRTVRWGHPHADDH